MRGCNGMRSAVIARFGVFELAASRRRLSSNGVVVKLGGRAFDVLLHLVLNSDRTVLKGELLDAIWSDVPVEEANIAVHINTLRKILGPGAITTVPRRGYQFVMPVQWVDEARSPVDRIHAKAAAWLRGELFGRAREMRRVLDLLEKHEVVTIWGPGGIGKTRLAQSVALAAAERYPGGVCWVDLASVTDAGLVTGTTARALGLSIGPDVEAEEAIAADLRRAPALLVLDNAEHVLAGVSTLTERLHAMVDRPHLLVTSQRAMRMPAETSFRLGSLDLPVDTTLSGSCLSGAVALFVACVQRCDPDFELDVGNFLVVNEICRRLDGVPLALELAASQVHLLGLTGVSSHLDERLRLLTRRGQGGLARHRTLRAAMDWSHSLLTDSERSVFRRVGIFIDGFSLEAVSIVAQDQDISPTQVIDCLEALVERSLVLSDGPHGQRYRLIESARLYALEKLSQADELEPTRERHARALVRLLTVKHEDERRWHTTPAAPAALAAEVSNCRSALDWACTGADDVLAVELAACASYAFLAASLNAEYLERVTAFCDRVHEDLPPRVVGLFWARIALSCSRNAHPLGFRAAESAAKLYRQLGDQGRLYDALTWAVAIGARLAERTPLAPLVAEAESIENTEWPLRTQASFQWAKHRWHLREGRYEDAMRCALAQAELLHQDGHWASHVAQGANVADCELSLERVEAAEQRAARALFALERLGVKDNLVGHVLDTRMVALVLLGRHDEAIEVGRAARLYLEREGDDLRLLEPLALNAARAGRDEAAALILAHVDSVRSRRGEIRWPPAAQRRALLHRHLAAALPVDRLRILERVGAALRRDQAFAHAFGDAGP